MGRSVAVPRAGNGLVAAQVTRRLIARFARAQPAPSKLPAEAQQSTERERETLQCVARGWSNARDRRSAQLHPEETTGNTHVRGILTKLGLRDRVQAVVYAFERGPAGTAT